MTTTKKLIEVALPLDAINKASAREKSIRHGHPSTLHLWWARRPLAAARAVIFAQMVDDPSAYEPDEAKAERERKRLFAILEDLVLWENTTNEAVLQRARDAIRESWQWTCAANADHPRARELFNPDRLPAFHDPFAGGGALPLEAQRLGLESHASDLNPVAVLINKAMIEIPPRFAGKPPVNPVSRQDKDLVAGQWTRARGLAEDVRYYGQWMRDEAEKRIGWLYPKVAVTTEMAQARPDLEPYVGQELTVIAWLWARTVKSPNPAFANVDVPLASTFMLSTNKGKEAYVKPVIENGGYRFTVNVGVPEDVEAAKMGTSMGKRQAFRCLVSGVPIPYDYIRNEGKAKRMGDRLMAVVAEGDRGRVYLDPIAKHEKIARQAKPTWKPDCEMPRKHRDFKGPGYGLNNVGDLFTSRQLLALTTFSDLVQEVCERVRSDALAAGVPDDGKALRDGGASATAYAEAMGVYLSMAVDKVADRNSTVCSWATLREHARNTFGRQAIPMVWDFAESNVFSDSSGNFEGGVDSIYSALGSIIPSSGGHSAQVDARSKRISGLKVVSTDPPYYDNIGYSDLSDFFYVWLRRGLRSVFPELFATLAVPKAEELVATPYRHGSREMAESFFMDGMTRALRQLSEQAHPGFPVTIYYAFKQSETKGDTGTASTGWETFLDAVIQSGFAIGGTWPIRTELDRRLVGRDTNALASSIVLVCRQRSTNASLATRREFVSALKTELPAALTHLQRGNIAPVDLAQAAIGPGMAIYTRYARVLDTHGQPLPVRDALALINQTLDEVLAEQEGDFDADTRWALAWFEQAGFDDGDYGGAETLSKAKNTSVDGLVEAGILVSRGGKVRLLKPDELAGDWNPATDPRLTAWETVHHLVHTLESNGEGAAAELTAALGSTAETARELCYRLYTLCERKKRAAEALSYNALVQSWPEIARLAQRAAIRSETGYPLPRHRGLTADTHGLSLKSIEGYQANKTMSVTNNVLQRVFRISFDGKEATCFTLDIDDRRYLITARHLVENVSDEETVHIFHDGDWKPLSVHLSGHGKENVDISVLAPQVLFGASPPLLATTAGLTLAEDVYFLGFPFGMSHEAGNLNADYPLPLVKRALVSRLPLADGLMLLDGHNNPGFSGGPVVRRDSSTRRLVVAGVVSGYRFDRRSVLDNAGAKGPYTYDMNTGIVRTYDIERAKKPARANPIGICVPQD